MVKFRRFIDFLNRILVAKVIPGILKGVGPTDTSCFGSGPWYTGSSRRGIRNNSGEDEYFPERRSIGENEMGIIDTDQPATQARSRSNPASTVDERRLEKERTKVRRWNVFNVMKEWRLMVYLLSLWKVWDYVSFQICSCNDLSGMWWRIFFRRDTGLFWPGARGFRK